MRSAILFDLDDTLIDRKASIRTYTDILIGDFSPDLQTTDRETLSQIVIKTDHGGYRPRAEVSSNLTRTLPWKTPPSADTLLAHWMKHFPLASEIRAHVFDVLQLLQTHDFSIGMVTNGLTVGQNRKVDTLGLRPYFSSIVISETAGIKKPAAAIFELALNELQKKPEETWFVGDNPLNDIVGATNVGLTPIWLRGPHPWPQTHPQPAKQIDNFDEIPAILGLPHIAT